MQEAAGGSIPSNKNMVVAVRIRPLSQKETSAGHKQCCNLLSEKIVVISKEQQAKYLRSQKGSCNEYAFDAAFDERSTQLEVYEATTKPFMAKLVEGFNVTVFAYGATGAGKTHTMMGNTRYDDSSVNAEAGIIPNALQDVFHLLAVEKSKRDIGVKWSVGVTFIEVYNEQVYDLLQPMGKCLPLREDKVKGVVEIAGVAEKCVDSPSEVLELLQQGNRYRKTEATMANQVSSRSHAVLQLMVRRTRTTPSGREAVVESKLSLIDLAGSERASATQNRGARLNEGANINKSLLALANCINALSEKSNGKATSVKFRDSKLTHLLRSSLEGNCSLVMIANINPSDKTFEDSHNTLKYANRAKNIKVDPTVTDTVKESNWVERETRLREENVALRHQVAELQRQMQMLSEAGAPAPRSGDFYILSEPSPAQGALPAVASSARFAEDIDDGMEVVEAHEPCPPSRGARVPAPMPAGRAGAFVRRHKYKTQDAAAVSADGQQADLCIDLRGEKTPRSARKRGARQQHCAETDKSLFTLGAAFTIMKDDEPHELLDTTAHGRAALLPKYSVRIAEEPEQAHASPERSANQDQESASHQRVTLLRRSARKRKSTHEEEAADNLSKYTFQLPADQCTSPQAAAMDMDGEPPSSLRRSARKRNRDEMSCDESAPPASASKRQHHRGHLRGHHDISASGLSDIVFLPERVAELSAEEIPVSDFLDDMSTRAHKKRRGSGIPLRNNATSASTSVLPSSSAKIHASREGPETDSNCDESFQLSGAPELVPLHAAKGTKPFLIGAATSYYNRISGKNSANENANNENIQKGYKVKPTVKSESSVPGKSASKAPLRTRAPLANYLSNKINGQKRNAEIAPL